MRSILDLHIHSRYSRACSRQLTLQNIDATCRQKGVDIIATGDFTFPAWFSDIENHIEEINGSGLFKLKKADDEKVKFILSTELSLVYKDADRARRIHVMLHAPSLDAVRELNKYLDTHFNIRSDGRPILGLSASNLTKLCLSIDPRFLIYPAHIWTPWYAVFGSKSGFDSMEACFHDQVEHIHAIETGLSSDPEMNWRISELDKYTILSNSDAHSLPNIGREANIMDLSENSYQEIYDIVKNKNLEKLLGTIEFYPEEGMYHIDGHRDCGFSCEPNKTKKMKGLCPKCRKPLIIGVLNRVNELADRAEGFEPEKKAPFTKLVELDKIIAEALGVKSRNSKKVQLEYLQMLKKFGPELDILMDIDLHKLEGSVDPLIVEGIRRVRAGELQITPGFDGQYGEIKIFSEKEVNRQHKLF